VAGLLEEAIERVVGHRVAVTGAGRTDRGVHAWGQVVSFDAAAGAGPTPLDGEGLGRALNKLCGPAIVVRDVAAVDDGFDARFSAKARVYRYLVLNRDVPDPFLHRTTWWVPQSLDLAALRLASDPLIGEHDFTSFCRRPKVPAEREVSLVRRVVDAGWAEDGEGLLRFDIEASAFCHQMVRSLVGTLIDAGRGKIRAGDLLGILDGGDRAGAGSLAPPRGLCLWQVDYA
jgi:tRNA pseudouridine38-40 synthase